MSTSSLLLRAGAVALASAAVAVPAAQASSIAYVKGGDVYLSTPDGSRSVKVTADGGYSDVSQADDGTMIALHGVRLHKLSRTGAVLSDIDTPASDTRPPGSRAFAGPYQPAISPDGTKVAYEWFYTGYSETPDCHYPTCVAHYTRAGTAYTYADHQTAFDDPTLYYHSGWLNPTWVDDDLTMLTDPTVIYGNQHVILDRPSEGKEHVVRDWFSDTSYGNKNIHGADITVRPGAKRRLVATEMDDTQLRVWRVDDLPAGDSPKTEEEYPLLCYAYGADEGKTFGTPTVAPDGSALAVAIGDTIYTAAIGALETDCSPSAASELKPLVTGASEPDWGPADMPAAGTTKGEQVAQPTAQQPAAQQPVTQQPATVVPGPKPDVAPTRTVTIKVAGAKLAAALRSGVRVKLSGLSAGSAVSATATRSGRVVASGKGRAATDGSASVKLVFTQAAKRSLKRAAKVVLVVRSAGQTTSLTLKR